MTVFSCTLTNRGDGSRQGKNGSALISEGKPEIMVTKLMGTDSPNPPVR